MIQFKEEEIFHWKNSHLQKIIFRVEVISCYKFLGVQIKSERVYKSVKELKRLWPKKLNFPHISDVKLHTLLKMYDQYPKKTNYEVLNALFDITLLNSNWLSSEDN